MLFRLDKKCEYVTKEKYLKKKLERAVSKIERLEENNTSSEIRSLHDHFLQLKKRMNTLESKQNKNSTAIHRNRSCSGPPLPPVVLNNTDPTEANSSLLSGHQNTPLYFASEAKRLFADDDEDELRSLLTEESLGGGRRQEILAPRKSKLGKALKSFFCQPPALSQ